MEETAHGFHLFETEPAPLTASFAVPPTFLQVS